MKPSTFSRWCIVSIVLCYLTSNYGIGLGTWLVVPVLVWFLYPEPVSVLLRGKK